MREVLFERLLAIPVRRPPFTLQHGQFLLGGDTKTRLFFWRCTGSGGFSLVGVGIVPEISGWRFPSGCGRGSGVGSRRACCCGAGWRWLDARLGRGRWLGLWRGAGGGEDAGGCTSAAGGVGCILLYRSGRASSGGISRGFSPEGFCAAVSPGPISWAVLSYCDTSRHHLAAALVLVSVVLPVLPLASEAAQEAWEHFWRRFLGRWLWGFSGRFLLGARFLPGEWRA